MKYPFQPLSSSIRVPSIYQRLHLAPISTSQFLAHLRNHDLPHLRQCDKLLISIPATISILLLLLGRGALEDVLWQFGLNLNSIALLRTTLRNIELLISFLAAAV